ncbi:MAG TPA: hypothetical protein VEN81_05615 [Planctomycetota bacterium]|nr:hypothetical protein [Planctomycetota bacterium]
MKNPGLLALALAVFAFALPPETWAQEAVSAGPERGPYARREAQAPGLEEFRGGCPGPDGPVLVLLILTLPVTLPIYGLFKLGEVTVHGVRSLLGGNPHPPPSVPRSRRPVTPPRPESPTEGGSPPLAVHSQVTASRAP